MSRSSAETKYRVMTRTACEMVWLKNLLMELDFRQSGPMPIHCDNQSAIYIAQNSVFHEKTKHIEIDYHFVRDARTQFTPSSKQLADLLTKAGHVRCLCSSLRGSVKLGYWYWVVTHVPSRLLYIFSTMNKTYLLRASISL